MKRKDLVLRTFSYVYVLIGCLLIGGPMYLTVANAMKDTQQFTNNFLPCLNRSIWKISSTLSPRPTISVTYSIRPLLW